MTENNRIEHKRELTNGLEKAVVAFLNYNKPRKTRKAQNFISYPFRVFSVFRG